MMQKRFGVGVVGCGHWGANYVRVFENLPNSSVLGACEQSESRREAVRERFPNIAVTRNARELLDNREIDAVVVCTEASNHYEVAFQCLQEGKHVLVEKPLTTVSDDSRRLWELAESHGRTLMVGHTFVYNAGVRAVREYLNAGEVGEAYYLYSRRTNLGPIRRDVNALWDLAAHDVSIFNYLLEDKPDWVSAVALRVLRNCREDVAFACLGYPTGVVGHIHVSWADPDKTREVVVVGSDKRIVFNDLDSREAVRVFHKGVKAVEPTSFGEYQLQMRDGCILSPRIDASEPLKNQCEHFLDCLETGKKPSSGAAEGYAVVRVLEAMDESVKLQGARVEIDWENEYESAKRYYGATAS